MQPSLFSLQMLFIYLPKKKNSLNIFKIKPNPLPALRSNLRFSNKTWLIILYIFIPLQMQFQLKD